VPAGKRPAARFFADDERAHHVDERPPAPKVGLDGILGDPGGTDHARNNVPQRLAAPELGAVLLGGAVSMEAGLPLVLVRKEPKGYGTSKQIEGRFEPGDRVTVIEDVVTTGGDSLRSAQVLRDAGVEVIHLVVVLDRGEGGEENIRKAGIAYSPLFRVADLELD
jgi:orotate phosphoribosyltransferase